MPIYEYACESCGTRFELLVRGGAKPVRCPACGGRKARKRFSVFSAPGGSEAAAAPLAVPSPRPT